MKQQKGFTIIEVVLVLAIAGLIFLMVFIALPNLQRTQRDTQRRNDLDRMSTAITQYVTNNNKTPSGSLSTALEIESGTDLDNNPSAWAKFAKNYLLANGDDDYADPNGEPYKMFAFEGVNDTANSTAKNNFDGSGTAVVVTQAKCSDDLESAAFETTAGNRSFAVAMRLEGSGIYCVDNH